jgi:hypothetical protein
VGICVYGLFYDAVTISYYTPLNIRVFNDLMWRFVIRKMVNKTCFSVSIINNEYNIGHVYIHISENQMNAVHNSNCMLLVHIYWDLFARVYLFVHVFQYVCLVCVKWVKEKENFNLNGNLYET